MSTQNTNLNEQLKKTEQHITIAKASGGIVYIPAQDPKYRQMVEQIANKLNCKTTTKNDQLIVQ